jgi:hypothetical protein
MKKILLSTALFVVFLSSYVGAPCASGASGDPIMVDVEITQDDVSLQEKKGARITCIVSLPEACRGFDIDAKSVTLGDKVVAASVTTYQDIAIIKFDRRHFLNFIQAENYDIPCTVNLALKGNFTDGASFAGNGALALIPSRKVFTYARTDKYSRGQLVIK